MNIVHSLRLRGLIVTTILISGSCLFTLESAAATSQEGLSRELTTLFRAARGVVSANQAHINDPAVGNKGLSGEHVIELMKQNYAKATGRSFAIAPSESLLGQAQGALLSAIDAVMTEAQPLINEQGKGFKGFLPAIFARRMASEFSSRMDGTMSIKLTAPMDYVRNRRNRPDAWENRIIEDYFRSAGYEKDKPYAERADYKGTVAYRFILPEYYGASCLGCHGEPKGERDITGGKKEGGKLGEVGGAISLVIFD